MYIFLFEAYSWLKLLETEDKFLKFFNNHKDCPFVWLHTYYWSSVGVFIFVYNYFTFAFQNAYFCSYNIYTLQIVFQNIFTLILCIYILCTHHLHFDYICTILKFNYLLSVIFVWFLHLSLNFLNIFIIHLFLLFTFFFKSIIYFLFK